MNAEEKRKRRHEKKVQAAAKALKKDKGKSKGKGGNEVLRTFFIALIVFVVVLSPLAMVLNNFLDTSPFSSGEEDEDINFEVLINPESPFFAEFSDSKRINLLLMGVNPPLTDTIMLASFDPDSKDVDIISIPRDTYYYREGYNTDAEKKINAAFRGDPNNTAKAVSDVLLGMPINYYAVIEYEDIYSIVDEMGGVPVYIPFDMDYDDEWDRPPLHIHFKEGQQTLNGEDSVKYLRYRKDSKPGYGYLEGDIGRVKAQQDFVKNAISQALDHGVLKVAKVAFEEIDSNITYKAMLSLATKALGMSSENITTYMIPGYADPEAPYYIYPKAEKIEEMIREIYSIEPETTTEGAVTGNE